MWATNMASAPPTKIGTASFVQLLLRTGFRTGGVDVCIARRGLVFLLGFFLQFFRRLPPGFLQQLDGEPDGNGHVGGRIFGEDAEVDADDLARLAEERCS